MLKQTVPTVKKASEFVNKKSHKQQKYISLMVVPSYSGGRTRSLSIPHTVFYGTLLLFVLVAALVFVFQMRSIHFQDRAYGLTHSLAETQEEFEEFQEVAAVTHSYLLNTTLDMYEQLTNENSRAQLEQIRQDRLHQDNFDGVQSHIAAIEQQIRDFEEERQRILVQLRERSEKIPPIVGLIRPMEVAQERIIDEFNYYTGFPTESAERSVGLLGGAYSPVNEAELQLQLEILAAELQLQQLLFQDLESHKARMETYLRNFPTLMPIDGGRITSFFGFRRDPIHGARTFHEGVDIPVPSGTPIRAAGGGTVIFEGWRGGYGNVVFIDHGGGLTTRYAHNSRHLVYVGQVVERGDIIALVGNTGRSVSPHLHYEVLRDGRQIDPMPFITEFWSE